MSVTTETPTRTSCRWFQFRLRTLLMVIAILAMPAAWIANERRAIAARQRAFAELRIGLHMAHGQPAWRVWLLGDDQVAYSRCIACSARSLDDEGAMSLRFLVRAENLYLDRVPITDVGVAGLKRLTSLRNLGLGDSKITDAGLVHLEGLTHLRWLDLSGTQITDAGLVHLQGLTHLEELTLIETKVTAEGVASLKAHLPNTDIVCK